MSLTLRVNGSNKQEMFAKMEASGLLNRGKDRIAYRYAFDYGFDQATDAKDAYMKAWANCMDLAR